METTLPFSDCGLSDALMGTIKNAGFINTTPIQEMTLAPILEGKDIFAQAETGSGKTGAFVIPIIEQIIRKDKLNSSEIQYVVLSPTRELAQQTSKVVELFGGDLGVKSACVIGGENIDRQEKLISEGAQILIATPGRLMDLVKQKKADLSKVVAVVFDEADRLFDMGFQKDIEYILKKISDHRQLIMVSATSNMEVLHTAYKFKSHPLELKLNEDSLLVDNINHSLAMINGTEKMPLLVSLLRKNDDYSIIFCNTQLQTHLVAEWLIDMGFKAKAISGRLPQTKRTRLMDEFRNKEITILVCTDVAARGLDIKDVTFVVNYDIPQDAANYVHRIGRTGRAGKKGQAISFCAHEDCEFLDPIYELIQAKIPKMDLLDSDFATDVSKKPYLDYKTLKVVNHDRNDKTKDRKKSKPEKPKETRQPEKRSDQKTAEPVQIKERVKRETEPMTNTKRIDRRFFEITSRNKAQADLEAMKYLGITDESLLDHKITKLGSKMFIFFGPSNITYQYFIKPMYKKLLLPFFIEIIKISGLKLYAKVFYKDPVINIEITGADEAMLKENNNELSIAFAHLAKQFLIKKIALPRDINITINSAFAEEAPRPARSNDRNSNKKPYANKNNGDRKYNNDKKNGDRKNSEKWLKQLAEKTMNKVKETNSSVMLQEFNPADRRIIHQTVNDTGDFKSTSIGDGRFKKIEISLN